MPTFLLYFKPGSTLRLFGATLCLLALSASSAPADPQQPKENAIMEASCQREVVELHRFFQEWFNAELPNEDASFARFAGVIAADFEIIGPEGRRVEGGSLLPILRGAHNRSAGKTFTIEVRNVRSRTVGGGMVLVTYEEHQTTDGEVRNWLSSALFRAREGTPNGVEWVHVQETYLPRSDD